MNPLLKLLLVVTIFSCNSSSDNKLRDIEKDISLSPILKKYYLNRPLYKMEYYADWKIDSSDTDFDIDSYLVFDSPSGVGTCSIFIFNTGIDEQKHIDGQVNAHLKKIIKNGKVSYFTNWGNYKGTGALIKGKILGISNGEIKAFAHAEEDWSVLIVSQLYDSDKPQDEPGLKLIESSFLHKN